MHGLASRNKGLLPPSAGGYPADGPTASLFFHLLPDIEQDEVARRYRSDPVHGPVAANVTIRTFCSHSDPSNPGSGAALTSFASNAQAFGLTDGGTTRYPQDFNHRGTSNTILFMQRYAVVGAAGTRHTWSGIGEQENYLYPPGARPDETLPPQFGVAPAEAGNGAAHAFQGTTLQVGLADGSARSVTAEATRTFTYGDGRTATVWAWACSHDSPLGKAPTPSGW